MAMAMSSDDSDHGELAPTVLPMCEVLDAAALQYRDAAAGRDAAVNCALENVVRAQPSPGEPLKPHQEHLVAMMIAREEAGKPTILAAAAGTGKARMVAALMRVTRTEVIDDDEDSSSGSALMSTSGQTHHDPSPHQCSSVSVCPPSANPLIPS